MYDLVVGEMAPNEKLASSITPRKQVNDDRNPNPFEDYLEAQKEELPVGMDEIANKSRRAAEGIRSKLRALKGRTVGCVGCPPNWRTSGKPPTF